MAFSLNKESSTHTVMTGAVTGYQTLIILKVCLQTADRPLLALLHLYRGLITYISFSYLDSYSFIFMFCLTFPFSPWYPTSAHLLHQKTFFFFFQFSLFFSSRQVMGRCEFISEPVASPVPSRKLIDHVLKTTKMSAYHFSS